MVLALTARVVAVGTGAGKAVATTVPVDGRNKVVPAYVAVRVFEPMAREEPLIENVVVDEVAPALRLAVSDKPSEVRMTLPVGPFPDAASMVTVIVASPVCPTVDRFVVTVIVVAEVTLSVVAADVDATMTGLTELSPLYLAVMELLPQIKAFAANVMLVLATLPEAVSV
jgi:hypothetical protein